MQAVSATDEWCAEAYMQTDYSLLTQDDFDNEIKKYIVFRLINESDVAEAEDATTE